MTVGNVHDQGVDLGFEQRRRSIEEVSPRPDRRRDQETALGVLRRVRAAVENHEVSQGDQPPDASLCIDQRQALDPVLEHQALGLVLRDPGRPRHEPLEGGHVGVDRPVLGARKPGHVPRRQEAGEDARALTLLDQNGVDRVPTGEGPCLADAGAPREPPRRLDHCAVAAFDAPDHVGLTVDRHRPVDHANAAFEGHRLGHLQLGDRVHVGGHYR